jgi:small-conductance mechanosensitive channel
MLLSHATGGIMIIVKLVLIPVVLMFVALLFALEAPGKNIFVKIIYSAIAWAIATVAIACWSFAWAMGFGFFIGILTVGILVFEVLGELKKLIFGAKKPFVKTPLAGIPNQAKVQTSNGGIYIFINGYWQTETGSVVNNLKSIAYLNDTFKQNQ